MAARMGSGAGHWKLALFLINTDTVTAFLGESERRGQSGHCLCTAATGDGPGLGVSSHGENRLLTPSFLHSPASLEPSLEPGAIPGAWHHGQQGLSWQSPAARRCLGTAFPGQGPPAPAVPGAQVLIGVLHNAF